MWIAIFHNIRAVIKAEFACRSGGLHTTVVPLPEHLSSECGMCLRLECDTELFVAIMNEHDIEYQLHTT